MVNTLIKDIGVKSKEYLDLIRKSIASLHLMFNLSYSNIKLKLKEELVSLLTT